MIPNPRTRLTVAVLIVLLISTQTTFVSAVGIPMGARLDSLATTAPTDWSVAVVESTMKRYPTAESLKGWGYAKSLYLYGVYLVYLRTKDKRYLDYIKSWVDLHIDDKGTINRSLDALDYMLPGNLLLKIDICEGTNVGDLAFYLARKRNTDDFHGLGAFLIMNEELGAASAGYRLRSLPWAARIDHE